MDDFFDKMQAAIDHQQAKMSDFANLELEYQHSKDSAVFETAELLELITEKMEQEHEERLIAERKSKRIQIIGLIVGVLTLIATVLLGLIRLLK